jgi:uncharacterized membrane protein YccC
MRDPSVLPSGVAIDEARVQVTAAIEEWVVAESARGADPAEISERIGADHRLRVAALAVEQMVELARLANGGDVERLVRRPPIPIRPRSQVLLSQLHLDSPWLRNALRSSMGLGLAVLVVNITGVTHGFWVLLGVISILRFDSVGTRKFALQAIVGTVVGVAIATVVVILVGQHQWVLWILLPVVVFLAAWSGPAISYPAGQAAFSALILVAFGIIAWPPDDTVGLVRIEDIALGAGVALVVGLLMWPRGAVGALRGELAVALRAGCAYFAGAVGSFASPHERAQLDDLHQRAVSAAERASETYDVALMQRGPAEDMRPWTTATTAVYMLISAGTIVSQFVDTTPTVRDYPTLWAALTAAQGDCERHWTAVADAVGEDGDPQPVPADPVRDLPVLPGISTEQEARALIVTIWILDWVAQLDRLSTGHAADAPVLA